MYRGEGVEMGGGGDGRTNLVVPFDHVRLALVDEKLHSGAHILMRTFGQKDDLLRCRNVGAKEQPIGAQNLWDVKNKFENVVFYLW